MRAAWIHTFPAGPASGVFMYQLTRAMEAVGVDIDLVGPLDLRSPSKLLRLPADVVHRARRADVVHAQYGSGCGFAVSRLDCGPKVVTIRGTDWYGPGVRVAGTKGAIHFARTSLGQRLTRLALPRYDRAIGVSVRMVKEMSGAVFRCPPLSVVPDGVDLVKFQPRARDDARQSLGDACRRPWIGVFSTLGDANPVKRIPLARAAAEVLTSSRPDARLRVFDDIPHDVMPTVVNACDVILLTSTHEGWPNIIKEALACNVPFVATDVSDLAAIAASEPACRVASPTPSALATALDAALELAGTQDPTRARGVNLRRFVEPMRLEACAGRLRGIYDSLLRRS